MLSPLDLDENEIEFHIHLELYASGHPPVKGLHDPGAPPGRPAPLPGIRAIIRRPMRAVVFDFDGVLVDSEPLHFQALRDAMRPEEITVTREDYFARYLAFDDREAIRRVLEDHDIAPDAERMDRIAVRKVARFWEALGNVGFFPGARELVRALASQVPLGIASGARRAEIEAILAAGGLREPFPVIVGAEDVPRTKPDPAPYLLAVRQLAAFAPGLEPGDCLAFEDSPPGIASARAAGMKVVGVAHSYPPGALRSAHRVVESLVGLEHDGLRALFAR
jgi:beta-phosphoglucomutase